MLSPLYQATKLANQCNIQLIMVCEHANEMQNTYALLTSKCVILGGPGVTIDRVLDFLSLRQAQFLKNAKQPNTPLIKGDGRHSARGPFAWP